MPKETESRKADHIKVCLEEDVQYKKTTGFEKVELIHKALPDIGLDKISLKTNFLGKSFKYPLFIESMTGGTEEAKRINHNLAKAAQELGIGMGVGSIRAGVEHPELIDTYKVRDVAPDIFLLSNLGAAQILHMDIKDIKKAVESIQADGLFIHLNPAQEVFQHKGDTEFSGGSERIKEVCSSVDFPVVIKEVGSGISGDVAKQLERVGVAAVDVAGAGGTNWIKVEVLRNSFNNKAIRNHDNFIEWGIPTAECLEDCKKNIKIPIIASGGIRSGLDCAKALALGADLCGMAHPLLGPALESSEAVKKVLEKIIVELRISMFLTGSKDLKEVKKAKYIIRN